MNKKEYQKQLKEAAGRVQRRLLDAAEQESASCRVTPSPEFRMKMEKILYRQEKPGRFRGRRRVVAVVMTLFLAVICWLAVDSKARAAVIDWVREITGNRTVYTFNIETEAGKEVYKIVPAKLPEGFELKEERWSDASYYAEYFCRNETNSVFILGVNRIEKDSPYQVIGHGEGEYSRIKVKGVEIDCYTGNDRENSDFVWIDEANRLFVYLSSSLSQEQNNEILEGLLVRH
nr:DUF4367 domain-containing protein [Lachnospiraceae bacterium]